MNFRPLATSLRAAALSLALLCTLAATRAGADCTYYSADTTTTYATAANPTLLYLTQAQSNWSAIAVRPQAGEDWDVVMYQNAAAAPACVANPLASSSYGGGIVDFVIGDYTHNPAGGYFASLNQFSGTNFGLLRWTNSTQMLPVNGALVGRSWNINDVVETWNVSLTAGTTYTLIFNRTAGIDAKVMLFANPGAGTYWSGRAGASLTSTTSTTYTAPATGTYAIVVVNDDGGTGTFSLGIGTCSTPAALASGTLAHTDLANDYFAFTQTSAYWTAVGARSISADYDLYVDGGTAGAGYPNCLSDQKSASGAVGKVDFVIGDFNHNPTGTYYAQTIDYSGPVGVDVEWDSGSDLLTVNSLPVSRSTGAGDVLEVWDVFLQAGQTYNFAFNPTSTNTHLLLFRNALAGVYWTGRASAEFDVTGCATYTAPSGGYYGVVVVNDSGEYDSYTLGVGQSPCTCPTVLASNTPASSPSPNGYFSFTQSGIQNTWSVVATRGVTNADDWDLALAGAATGNPAPTCMGAPLLSSGYGAGLVDIGVIDFNNTPTGTYFARSTHFSGGALSGEVEWDASHGYLSYDAPYSTGSMASTDLAHAWEAFMWAGETYTVEYFPSDATIKLLVFENAGAGSYIATRASAVLTTSATITYTPATTGIHGFVVVNDQAINGSYMLRVGDCNVPMLLNSGVTTPTPYGVNTFSFAQATPRWAGVGVRSYSKDFDLRVSATQSGPFPNCLGGTLASSGAGALNYVDFVVGDFFHTPLATYYAQAYQFSSGGLDPAEVEWSGGLGEVLVNDNDDVVHATDINDVVSVWNVNLSAGQSYTFNFTHTGAANLHLLVFRNAAGTAYWSPRSGSVADLTPGGGPFTYVAPSSGEYGIAVVNDDGAADTYRFNVKACFTPTALASTVVQVDAPENFHTFNQTAPFWTAVGVRSASDWDINVNSSGVGGAPGFCQSGLLAASLGVGVTDFVVGDFNAGANAPGTYYVRDYRFAGAATGSVEWDSGSDLVAVGGALTHRATGASDVLEVWDVRLLAGQTYAIYFAHTGAADVKVMLFRNPGGAYWAPRNANVYANTVAGNFTAPATGYYGLVVVNDNGAAGTYDVGVYGSALAVQPGTTTQPTALRSVQPNPARAGMHVEYALSQRAPVRVQMLDLAGRVVAEMENGTREAGVWQAGWNGLTRTGQRAAPGVYLVRLEVGGRTIGQRKVTVLE